MPLQLSLRTDSDQTNNLNTKHKSKNSNGEKQANKTDRELVLLPEQTASIFVIKPSSMALPKTLFS